MLIFATLATSLCGLYSVAWAVIDVWHGARLEIWAELALMFFGALLTFSSALLRARVPGGLAFSLGAWLGLQALAVHNAVHLDTGIAAQVGQAGLAAVLLGTAWLGTNRSRQDR
jgi:hypothetical protein